MQEYYDLAIVFRKQKYWNKEQTGIGMGSGNKFNPGRKFDALKLCKYLSFQHMYYSLELDEQKFLFTKGKNIYKTKTIRKKIYLTTCTYYSEYTTTFTHYR